MLEKQTPLHLAVMKGHIDSVAQLLRNGALVDFPESNFVSLLGGRVDVMHRYHLYRYIYICELTCIKKKRMYMPYLLTDRREIVHTDIMHDIIYIQRCCIDNSYNHA